MIKPERDSKNHSDMAAQDSALHYTNNGILRNCACQSCVYRDSYLTRKHKSTVSWNQFSKTIWRVFHW